MGVPITGLLATALPRVVKIVAADGAEYHVIPSWEYAIGLVPFPTATHLTPFHATPLPCTENGVVAAVVQLMPPSVE